MLELQDLFLYAAGAFIVWAMKRMVDQLDGLERRVRQLEIENAGMRGRMHLERGGDLEEPG